jgi:predicted DNA-binding transcriptional regulator AlpA
MDSNKQRKTSPPIEDQPEKPARKRVFVRRKKAAEREDVSVKTIDRWSDAGLYPPKVRLGPNIVGFWEWQIEEWEANRQQATR